MYTLSKWLGLGANRVKVGGQRRSLRRRGALAIGAAVAAVATVSAACTQASEGKPVKIPTFGETPTSAYTAPAETTTWTPTWEASIPAPVIKPTTKPPAPKPTKTTPTPTPEPTFTIPTMPGIPFAREGSRCTQEGAVAISRSGEPLVCLPGRGDQLRWRKP